MDRTVAADTCPREPDLAPIGNPCEPLDRRENAGKRPRLAGAVDDHDRSAVVAANRMIQKRNDVSLWGNTRVADPSGGLVENLAGRILELLAPADLADKREARSIGRPVCPLDIGRDLAGRDASRHADLRECPGPQERLDDVPV